MHHPESEVEKIKTFQHELQDALSKMPAEQQEVGIRQYLLLAANMTNQSRLQLLLSVLEQLVSNNILAAK